MEKLQRERLPDVAADQCPPDTASQLVAVQVPGVARVFDGDQAGEEEGATPSALPPPGREAVLLEGWVGRKRVVRGVRRLQTALHARQDVDQHLHGVGFKLLRQLLCRDDARGRGQVTVLPVPGGSEDGSDHVFEEVPLVEDDPAVVHVGEVVVEEDSGLVAQLHTQVTQVRLALGQDAHQVSGAFLFRGVVPLHELEQLHLLPGLRLVGAQLGLESAQRHRPGILVGVGEPQPEAVRVVVVARVEASPDPVARPLQDLAEEVQAWGGGLPAVHWDEIGDVECRVRRVRASEGLEVEPLRQVHALELDLVAVAADDDHLGHLVARQLEGVGEEPEPVVDIPFDCLLPAGELRDNDEDGGRGAYGIV